MDCRMIARLLKVSDGVSQTDGAKAAPGTGPRQPFFMEENPSFHRS